MVIKMLNIEQKGEGTVALTGRLDTVTAPQLETVLDGILPDTESLTLDFEGLEYISSAGLRLLLKAQKIMCKKGGMKLLHVSDEISEIFDITGFSNFLVIEK